MNSFLLNGFTPNGLLGLSNIVDADIVFENYSLQSENVCVNRANRDNLANVELNVYDTPLANGGGTISKFYRDRTITFSGYLKATNEDGLNTVIDNFKQAVHKKEGNLDIKFGGTVRRIKANCTAISLDREHYNINYLPFSVSFTCKESFFYEIAEIETSYVGKTADFQDEIINYGTAEVYSSTIITFNSASSVTQVTIRFDANNIVVNTACPAGTILIFDGVTKSVKKNGIEIDFTGAFFPLQLGRTEFTFASNGTKNVDISNLYKKSFL